MLIPQERPPFAEVMVVAQLQTFVSWRVVKKKRGIYSKLRGACNFIDKSTFIVKIVTSYVENLKVHPDRHHQSRMHIKNSGRFWQYVAI
jgi:hypothetical protein